MLRALDISQEFVEAGDLRLLTGLFDDPDIEAELAHKLRATVMLTFECYEEDDVPIFLDGRVSEYLRLAHDRVPHLLYYLSPDPAAGALLGFGAAYGALVELPDSRLLAVDLGLPMLERLSRHLAAAARHAEQHDDVWEPVIDAHLGAFDDPLRTQLHDAVDGAGERTGGSTMELTDLDAIDQATLVRNGDVTPTELVEAAIARIEALDPTIGALSTRASSARSTTHAAHCPTARSAASPCW